MADLNALYQQLLGRGADTSGSSYYGNMGEDQIRSSIMASPEYQGRLALQQGQPAAQPASGANSNFYVPQSLLNSLGVNSAQAQAGQYTPASNPWQGYTAQPQTDTATTSTTALNSAIGAAGNNVGGLGGLGGFNPAAMQTQMQQQAQTFQQQMQQQMTDWQKSLGANFGKTYNPTGTGGSFSNVQSPVYRPGGQTDTGMQAANGFGGSWGNGPFKSVF